MHSFRTSVQDLGMLAQNTPKIKDREDTLVLKTRPTELQRRAFQKLGVTPWWSETDYGRKIYKSFQMRELLAFTSETSD